MTPLSFATYLKQVPFRRRSSLLPQLFRHGRHGLFAPDPG
jgi:hypothetical protein